MPQEMKVFRETTSTWTVKQANHTYILSPNKEWMYGYVPADQPASKAKLLKNRIKFDTRYRTFKEVK
jgi:hypothetical protein